MRYALATAWRAGVGFPLRCNVLFWGGIYIYTSRCTCLSKHIKAILYWSILLRSIRDSIYIYMYMHISPSKVRQHLVYPGHPQPSIPSQNPIIWRIVGTKRRYTNATCNVCAAAGIILWCPSAKQPAQSNIRQHRRLPLHPSKGPWPSITTARTITLLH